MENASKALLIAGGVLIAIVVISVLVIFYGNLKGWVGSKQQVEVAEQTETFNKQYDVYYRDNIYGSELYSLVNKVVDYNEKYSKYDGYTKLEMYIKFAKDVKDYEGHYLIKANQTYNSSQFYSILEDLKEKKEQYEKKSNTSMLVDGKTIASLSTMRTKDLLQFLGKDPYDQSAYNDSTVKEVQKKINYYLNYKANTSTIKSYVFEVDDNDSNKGFKYDNKNGRITEMYFVQRNNT